MDYSEIKSSFAKSRTGLIGLGILACLVIASIFAIIAIPVETYKNWNNPASWTEFPKSAQPIWVNWVSVKKIPEHMILDSHETVIIQNNVEKIAVQKFGVDYSYDYFPGEFLLDYKTEYSGSPVLHISVTRPDGVTLKLLSSSLPHSEHLTVYSDKIFSTNESIRKNLRLQKDVFSFPVQT
ncbi:MAG TPA: ABC transporter permease, partial [Candidatus Nitrosotenuis sp.]|nr:ABC transporter permease [Candidatus Nitrosotenuis sp.]